MKTIAFCGQMFAESVRRAAGVAPLTCPPFTTATIRPEMFSGYDLVYFKLHGLPDQPYWYGDGWITALREDQVRAMRLDGAVVFVANCFLSESPMLQALLDAGASAVIGGDSVNFAAVSTVEGADRLGFAVRKWLELRLPVERAMELAKLGLRFRARCARGRRRRVIEDALGFEVFTPTLTPALSLVGRGSEPSPRPSPSQGEGEEAA